MKATEPLRLIGIIITAIIALLTALGISVSPDLQDTALAIISSVTTIVASIWALLEWARGLTYSPKHGETLAKAVIVASQTGQVPVRAEKLAKSALGEAVDTVLPPGLLNEALSLGLEQSWVIQAGAELTRGAIKAMKRAPTEAEMAAKATEGL